jgi:phosphomannomutase
MTLLSHTFHPSILREYDIRGIYGETLTNEDARAIGDCFSHFLGSKYNKTVVVGMDGRLSSPALEAALVQGLQEAGINVICIGVGPTPLLYYAVHALHADGGIMITGSHNPSEYNGFKMTLQDRPIFGPDIRRFPHLLEMGHSVESTGTVRKVDIKEKYIQRLLKDYRPAKHLKVVWDAGNGATGEVLETLVKQLPGEHIVLYSSIDGTFPHHHPDPTDEHTLGDIKRTVLEHKAHIGIAFDGDGDRLGVVDNEGNLIGNDHLLMLFARDLLKHHFGAMVISDVKASEAVFEDVQSHGGKPLMWKTGHSFIKQKMKETGALLAGEMSGHFFFADHYYGFDDALYAAIRFLNIVGALDCSLALDLVSLPSYTTSPEMRIHCADDRKFEVIKEIKERLQEEPSLEVCDLDGLRVKTDKGWWLVRASNTQDMLVCRCEAGQSPDLLTMVKTLERQLLLSGVSIENQPQ